MSNVDDHPYLKTNLLGKLFYSWVTSLLLIGHKRPLEYDDIFSILPDDKSEPWINRLEKKWNHEIDLMSKRNAKKRKASLLRATWFTYQHRYCAIGIYFFFNIILRFIQPFILSHFIRCFEPCSTTSSIKTVFWALLNSIIPWLMFTTRHMALTLGFRAGIHLRCAYHGLIFRKILRLSMGSFGDHSSGKIQNLMTNDVQTVEFLGFDAHFLWIGILETVVVLSILWSYVGATIFLAIFYTILVIFIQMICGKIMEVIWTKRVKQTDLRLNLINEIVKSIYTIKMQVWEKPFQFRVEQCRKKETSYMTLNSLVNTVDVVNAHSFPLIFFLIIFGILWYHQHPFDTEFFTVALVLVHYLKHTYLHGFANSFINLSQYLVALKRIEEFLLCEEFSSSKSIVHESESNNEQQLTITIEHLTANWLNSSFILRDINLSMERGDLVMIIGSTASGKSSLLLSLLGEMKLLSGTIKLNENKRFCYVTQEPWIFSGSIKENILFGEEFDHEKFNRCIYATGLTKDLVNLEYGDSTLVGDNGIVLSGGQKSRISLARALYRDEDIYLIDDPFSAVDNEVARHIFKKCILGTLKTKICILVTHQVQYLKYATKVVLLDNGIQVATGTYKELQETSIEFNQWMKTTVQSPNPDLEISADPDNGISSFNATKCLSELSLVSTSQSYGEEENLLSIIDKKPVQDEAVESKRSGSVKSHIFIQYIREIPHGFYGLMVIGVLFLTTSFASLFVNWWLGRWANSEKLRYAPNRLNGTCQIEDQSAIKNLTDVQWAQKRNQYFYVFLMLVIANIILLFLRTISYFIANHVAARALHNQMFNSLLRTPVLFFDTNPIGRIINRFSKDTTIIDEDLPEATYNFIEVFFTISVTILFTIFVQPLSLIPLIIISFVLIRIRRSFAPTVRDIKRLESIGRSPIYSYLSTIIQGVLSIRSYGNEKMCFEHFCHSIDEHTRVCSVMIATTRWAATRIECAVATFIGILMFSMIIFHRNLPTSDMVLILAYSLSLVGSVQLIIRLSVDVVSLMTSTERVIEYIDLKSEELPNNDSSVAIPPHWPIGSIDFENVSFRYSMNSQWTLKNINISIKPGEKIGVVGRTGAGKTSLVRSLFRLAEIQGRILIDEIDTKQIPLFVLRQHLSTIPQDPVLFNDTLRVNLDPFGRYSDVELWNALNQVQFKSDIIQGLQHKITEGGLNLSVGQRQLICLARAILRKTRILVVDEATANIDYKTEELIQMAIRQKFSDCTVITIAHRLRTIIDSDKILTLSNGEVVEFGNAYELLLDAQSHFSQLVSQAGQQEAEYLREQAVIAAKTNISS